MWESVVVVFIVVMVIVIFAVATTREEEGETMRKKVESRKEERDRPNRHDMEPWREPICAMECAIQVLAKQLDAAKIEILKLKRQGANIMGELQDVKNAIAQVKTDLATEKAEVAAEIQRLKDQIAAGSPVTPADLDELITSVKEIGQGVQDIFTPGT